MQANHMEGRQDAQESYYTRWRGIEIMFHVAPMLSADQFRRLIGNDICVIIYYDLADENGNLVPFDYQILDELGKIPQVRTYRHYSAKFNRSSKVFAIVNAKDTNYTLQFIRRENLNEFNPLQPPRDHPFSLDTILQDFLFTKMHNGLLMAKQSPPFNRLYCVPRAAALSELAKLFPRSKKMYANTEDGHYIPHIRFRKKPYRRRARSLHSDSDE